jgi:hypothetical protein
MRPVWPQYFACANLFLYVISINATGLLATAVIELHSLLIHPDIKVLLLILKTDCVYLVHQHVATNLCGLHATS